MSVGIVERPTSLSTEYAVLCPALGGDTGGGVHDGGRGDDAMSSAVASSGLEGLDRSGIEAAYRGGSLFEHVVVVSAVAYVVDDVTRGDQEADPRFSYGWRTKLHS